MRMVGAAPVAALLGFRAASNEPPGWRVFAMWRHNWRAGSSLEASMQPNSSSRLSRSAWTSGRSIAVLIGLVVLGALAAHPFAHAARPVDRAEQLPLSLAAPQATGMPKVQPMPYAPLIHLPVLGSLDADTPCASTIVVQNVGHEP